MRACAQLCDTTTTCSAGRVCAVFGAPVATNVVGVCVKACTPANQASCGANQTCTPNLWRPDGTLVVGGVCTVAGNAAVGQDCSNALCVAGAACFGGGPVPGIACEKLCDAKKDCLASEACTLYSNDPSNPYGLCLAPCNPAMPNCPDNRTCQPGPTVTGTTVYTCF